MPRGPRTASGYQTRQFIIKAESESLWLVLGLTWFEDDSFPKIRSVKLPWGVLRPTCPFLPSFVAVTLNPYPSERTKSFTVIKFERNRTKASWSLERGIWPPNLFQIFSGTVFQDSSFPFFLIVFFSLCATSHDCPRNPRDSKNVSRALSISLKPRDGISKPSISVAAKVLLNLCLSVVSFRLNPARI